MSSSSTIPSSALGTTPARSNDRGIILDGATDIALTKDLEQMRTEATGRKIFQKVYLWTSFGSNQGTSSDPTIKRTSNKATTIKYDPNVDGPDKAGPCPILPGTTEVIPHIDAKEYLEVGIIIGDDPERFKPIGLARNKRRHDERKNRGVLPRDPNAMRVFVPTTTYMAEQAKFYVGCRPSRGRLTPRVVEAACVFFYPEFWRNIDQTKQMKERLIALTTACKYHAATNKFAAPTNGPGLLACNKLEFRIYLLFLEYAVIRSAERDTYTISAFMAFDSPLSDELCSRVASQFRLQNFKPALIKAAHSLLCIEKEQWEDKEEFAQKLSPSQLCSFLQSCKNLTPAGGPERLRDTEVALALKFLKTHPPNTTSNETGNSSNTARKSFHNILQAVIELVNLIPDSTTIELPATNDYLAGTVNQPIIQHLETSFDNLYHSIFFGKDNTQNLELLNQLLEMGHACYGKRKK